MATPAYSLMSSHMQSIPSAGRPGDFVGSESEVSSVADLSTTMAPSDTDEDVLSEVDTRKNRVQDVGQTRTQIRTNGLTSPLPTTISPTLQASPRRYTGEHDTSDSDFYGSGASRAGSIYSLSRVSLASQLSQLTSIRLPSASHLSAKMSSMPTAHAAACALSDSCDQIKRWTKKAGTVIDDLDAKDDVEWAAAGGREGLEDVDQAINRFEGLVKVYVISVEELHMRKDVASLSTEEMGTAVAGREGVVKEWQKIKESMRLVKEQVEIAMEWEELWNNVLGEIGQELGALGGLVFEMEEKRHRTIEYQVFADATKSIDINDLENIVEDKPASHKTAANPRYSLPPPFSPTSTIESPAKSQNKDDSNLLALFARMQPLRASLDFLPMRLSVFHCRGNALFPTACVDLEMRRDALEAQWKKLEADAESLRKELGEDRWIIVFRNAGRQALKMCESVERSYDKLRAVVINPRPQTDNTTLIKLIENYEAKKTHYVPAVERVLAIIDRGVMDRLTVNGEVLRLQSDLRRRWSSFLTNMRELDIRLEDMDTNSRGSTLRDSISTIMSSERSIASSSLQTPGSSPASSVVMSSRKSSFNGATTPTGLKRNTKGVSSKRITTLPLKTSIPVRTGTPSTRAVSSPFPRLAEPYTGKRNLLIRELREPTDKPRWNASTVVQPSPARRESSSRLSASPQLLPKTPLAYRTLPPRSEGSSIPLSSPLSYRSVSPSPDLSVNSAIGRNHNTASPHPLTPRSATAMGNRTVSSPLKFGGYKRTMSSTGLRSATPSGLRRPSLLGLPPLCDENDADSELTLRASSRTSSRPPSALAPPSGRRSSYLRAGSRTGGRDSMMGNRGGAQDKPSWRS